jgi:hypothetical protein
LATLQTLVRQGNPCYERGVNTIPDFRSLVIAVSMTGATMTATLSLAGAVPSTELNESIRANRMGVLVVEGPADAVVRVEQIRHAFWFGAALANQVPAHLGEARRWSVVPEPQRFTSTANGRACFPLARVCRGK